MLQSHEVIGQVLTNTTPSSLPEWQQRYREYMERLSVADVLAAMIPLPAAGASAAERQRFHDDLKITTGYVRAALANRDGKPCCVELVLTKIESAFRTPEEARQLTEPMLRRALAPLVNLVTLAESVRYIAIILASSFGFGNAVRKAEPSHPLVRTRRPITEDRDDVPEVELAEPDETIWTVRPDALVVPFNVNTLMVWSLLHGLRVQSVDPEDEQTEALVEVGRMLKADLESLDGWIVPLR